MRFCRFSPGSAVGWISRCDWDRLFFCWKSLSLTVFFSVQVSAAHNTEFPPQGADVGARCTPELPSPAALLLSLPLATRAGAALSCWSLPSTAPGAVSLERRETTWEVTEEHGPTPVPAKAMPYDVANTLCWSPGDSSHPFSCDGEQIGGESSPRAVTGGLLFPVSAQPSRGAGPGDGKVPATAVCREHLCPGDTESVPLTPLPFSPWGHGSPFPALVHPSSPGILASLEAACSYSCSLAVPSFVTKPRR